MTPDGDPIFGLAEAPNAPILYLPRIRSYYQALGYGAPYEGAHFTEVPFQPLRKPLSECRIALITTAAPVPAWLGRSGAGCALQRQRQVLQRLLG